MRKDDKSKDAILGVAAASCQPSLCFAMTCCAVLRCAAHLQITIVRQTVVAQELPAEQVKVPNSPTKPLQLASAAAAKQLKQHGKCPIRVRQGQLQRTTELVFRVRSQLAGRSPARAAAAAAAAGDEAAAEAAEQREGMGGRGSASKPRKCVCVAACPLTQLVNIECSCMW
jgi:hypothetical protein